MARLIGQYIDAWNSLHYITHYGNLLSPADQEKTRALLETFSREKSKMLRELKKALPAFKKSLDGKP